jgi:hypothetical protein
MVEDERAAVAGGAVRDVLQQLLEQLQRQRVAVVLRVEDDRVDGAGALELDEPLGQLSPSAGPTIAPPSS